MHKSILDQIRSDPKFNPNNSLLWFQNKVKELLGSSRISSMKMLGDNQPLQTQRILPGRMYAYVYDPKTKEKLPYYDNFPLVLPFQKYDNGFLGLNLHYLPYQLRLLLLNKLMMFARHNNKGEVAYLKFSWELISSMSNLKEVQPCIKRYLTGYVKSRFIEIPPESWATAVMLPMENFKKTPMLEVWKRSRRMIGK